MAQIVRLLIQAPLDSVDSELFKLLFPIQYWGPKKGSKFSKEADRENI